MSATKAERVTLGSPVAKAVEEAVDAVAAPDVRVQILHRALHMAREHRIPEYGAALEQFVQRHLRLATVFYVGEAAGEAVMNHLAPIITRAQTLDPGAAAPAANVEETTRKMSGLRPAGQKPPMLPTDKYPTVRPSGTTLPMVLVASSSAARCQSIEEHLEGAAAVQQIEDVVAFLDNLQATASLSPLVVIDCVEAAVQPTTLATLTHELPPESAVLLWGAAEHDHQDLNDLAARDQGWLRCGKEATPSDVAALIHMLIGD